MTDFKDNFDMAMGESIGKGKIGTDQVWVSKTVNTIIGSLANNNMLIDKMLKKSHDIVGHIGHWPRNDQVGGDGGEKKTYYNDDENSLESLQNNLCKNNKSVCKEELSYHSGLSFLSIPARAAMLHSFVIMIGGFIWVCLKIFLFVMMLIGNKKNNNKDDNKDDDKDDKPRLIAVFENIVKTIRDLNFGLGPAAIASLLKTVYMTGIGLWVAVHIAILIINVFVSDPGVVSEFFTSQTGLTKSPGILGTIRFPIVSKDFFAWIKDPWIVTPMDARDNGNICKGGFEPSGDGGARKRKKVSYEEADNLKWCIRGGACTFGGEAANDKTDYEEFNKKDRLQYSDIGDIAIPFDNRCQVMKNAGDRLAQDVGKFADVAGKKMVSLFEPKE